MGIEYAILPFGPDIVEAYSRLFPGDPDKTPQVLTWRFRDNPHGQGMFAIARENATIQGMIALVPTSLIADGERVRGFQAIDTIVNPEMQGRFVFVRLGRLAEDFVAEQNAVLWGFPNAAAARGWFGRLGWIRTGSAPFLIRPLRTGYFFQRFAPVLSRVDFRLFRGDGDADDERQPAIDERYQRLWDLAADDLGIGVDRTRDWLSWRLAKPGSAYEWSYGRGGSSFVATRTVAKHGGIVAYVMEALTAPGTGAELSHLLRREIARLGSSAGAEVALAWCSPRSANYRHYRAAGFLPFPDRFRPAEIHHGYWRRDGEGSAPAPLEPWYLSYLDSDTV